MLDITKPLTTSASVRALTGSSRPGAVPPLMPLLTASAVQPSALQASEQVDAEAIDLAERVMALVERENALWDRRSAVEGAVDEATPLHPSRLMDTASGSFEQALAEHDRHVEEVRASLGLPRWEKLADRASCRLGRWGEQLARMAPRTQVGLRAKAAASTACTRDEIFSLDGWRKDLANSISRDALRIIGAEAEACVHSDRIVEMYREATAMMAIADDPAIDAETSSSAADRSNALEQIALTTPPRTLDGAIACIEWGLADHMRFRMTDVPDQGDHLLMALLTGALAVLRDVQEFHRLASAA